MYVLTFNPERYYVYKGSNFVYTEKYRTNPEKLSVPKFSQEPQTTILKRKQPFIPLKINTRVY